MTNTLLEMIGAAVLTVLTYYFNYKYEQIEKNGGVNDEEIFN